MMEEETLAKLQSNGQIAFRYVKPPHCHPERSEGSHLIGGDPSSQAPQDDNFVLADGEFPYNPNGSVDDIAAIADQSGKILAIMPHPERGMFTWQRDDYAELKDAAQRAGATLHETADGMALFENAASYFGVKSKKAA